MERPKAKRIDYFHMSDELRSTSPIKWQKRSSGRKGPEYYMGPFHCYGAKIGEFEIIANSGCTS